MKRQKSAQWLQENAAKYNNKPLESMGEMNAEQLGKIKNTG